jgi:hypothetical protein
MEESCSSGSSGAWGAAMLGRVVALHGGFVHT